VAGQRGRQRAVPASHAVLRLTTDVASCSSESAGEALSQAVAGETYQISAQVNDVRRPPARSQLNSNVGLSLQISFDAKEDRVRGTRLVLMTGQGVVRLGSASRGAPS
jgi:hypothetical protein